MPKKLFVFTLVAVMATLIVSSTEAGTITSGLLVEFEATRAQDNLPASMLTKRMLLDNEGTHTFFADARIVDRNGLDITDRFVGFRFQMILERSGTQPNLVKEAIFNVTANGIRAVGSRVRINFNIMEGDSLRLTFAPTTQQFLLFGEKLTANLFLTKEPKGNSGLPEFDVELMSDQGACSPSLTKGLRISPILKLMDERVVGDRLGVEILDRTGKSLTHVSGGKIVVAVPRNYAPEVTVLESGVPKAVRAYIEDGVTTIRTHEKLFNCSN